MKTNKSSKTYIHRDDKIIVISGRERGKTGKVLRIYPGKRKLLLRGLNMVKQHVRPSRDIPQGGIIDKEALIDISDVMLYCSNCDKGVRVGIKKFPDGTKNRYCKRCEAEL